MPSMRLTLISTRSDSEAARFAGLCNALAMAGHRVDALCPPGCGNRLAPAVRHVPWRVTGPGWNPLAQASLALGLLACAPEAVFACDDQAAKVLARLGRELGPWKTGAFMARPSAIAARFDRVLAAAPDTARMLRAQVPGLAVELAFPAAPAVALDAEAGQTLRERMCVPYAAPVVLAAPDMGKAQPLADLLEIWPQVGDAELWVTGSGAAAKELLAQARALGLLIEGGYDRGGQINGVRWLGRREDGPALLAACDLVVLPGRGVGQTRLLAEALFAQKPVVAVGVPWAQEVLPANHALPADAGSCALREALAVAVADMAFVRERQAEAFARVGREWTLEALAGRVGGMWADAPG